MNPCELKNRTSYNAKPLLLADEDGRLALVVVVKGSFAMVDRGSRLVPREIQPEVRSTADHNGDPGASSVRFEEDTAPFKPGTDVILVGHAQAPQKATSQLDVTLRLGVLKKTVRVFGDRLWVSSLGMRSITRPQPFDMVPLLWERSYGGHEDGAAGSMPGSFEPRNPVGVGFRLRGSRLHDGARLPNLEDPSQLIRDCYDRPGPAGFGFINAHWQPRAGKAGTYDEDWRTKRCPLLPRDFDPAFYNAAPEDQIVARYIRGGEQVEVIGTNREGAWRFEVPRLAPPRCNVSFARRPPVEAATALDTLLIDTDEAEVQLTWRTRIALREPPHEIRGIEVLN